MNYENILVLLIVLGICLSFNELDHSLLAVSPSVSFTLINQVRQLHPGSQILSADYYSDGKTLNATIWLPSHLGQAGLRFGMVISLGGIVSPVAVYRMYIENEYNGSLTNHMIQTTLISGPNASVPQYAYGTLDGLHAFTGSYDNANRFVDLSLNLVRIGPPTHYSINFYLANRSQILDLTGANEVPACRCAQRI
jgi:hypothetical protein